MSHKKKEKGKKVFLPKRSKINEKVVYELDSLLEFAPPGVLNKNIREIFMLFLCHEHNGLPHNFQQISDQFYFLFKFLDKAHEEMSKEKE